MDDTNTGKLYPSGVVVGRFQPFHHGHLEYVLQALGLAEHLYIGITTPGETATPYEPNEPARFGKANNPFSYEEREAMITEALKEAGINLGHITFVHFDPQHITQWHAQVPGDVVYFLLLLGNEEQKVKDMQAQGLKVHVLDRKENRDHIGSEIRTKIATGEAWEHLVPNAVAEQIKKLWNNNL